jgi:hypothetical protein
MNKLSFPRQSLSASQIEDIRLAASKMHGEERRAFQAEMALKYCESNIGSLVVPVSTNILALW